jgi:hypothetical protein
MQARGEASAAERRSCKRRRVQGLEALRLLLTIQRYKLLTIQRYKLLTIQRYKLLTIQRYKLRFACAGAASGAVYMCTRMCLNRRAGGSHRSGGGLEALRLLLIIQQYKHRFACAGAARGAGGHGQGDAAGG